MSDMDAGGHDTFAAALNGTDAPQIEGTIEAGDAGQVEGTGGSPQPETPEPNPDAVPQPGTAPDARQAQDRHDAMVPSWRLREISEQRAREQADFARATRELEDLRQFKAQQEAERKRQEEEKRLNEGTLWEAPDPNAFIDARLRHGAEQMLSPVQQQMQQMHEQMRIQAAEFSHQMALQQHGQEKVDAAYQRVQQAIAAGDPTALQLQARAANPRDRAFRDPTGAILAWDRERHVLNETKGDLDSYAARIREEARQAALQDPEFRQQVIEAHRQQATPVQTGVPGRGAAPPNRTIPSLNRQTSSRDATGEGDVGDVFAQTIAERGRRAG